MAEKLSITIALEGGKAIEQQLEGIGKAGQKAFEDISAAAQKAGGFKNLKPEEVTDKLKTLGVTGEDAFNKITGAVAQATKMERLVGIVQGIENGFASLAGAATSFARALGPIGLAAGAIGTLLVKNMTEAAEAINKVDAAAIKAGLSIKEFDTLRAGFEAAGLSAKQVESGMSAIAAAAEKAKLKQVADDFKALQEAATRGFGGQGTEQWLRLTAAMQEGGKAGDAAKKAITDLGGTISESATKSLPDLIIKYGDVTNALRAFVDQLRAMPDSTGRSQQAIDALGSSAGVALVQALRTGAITADQFRERLGTLTQEQANAANTIEQEWNRVGSAWERLKTTLGATLLVNVPTNLVDALTAINNLLDPAKWTEWGNAAKQAFIDLFAPIGELEVKIAHLVASLPEWFGKVFGGGGEPGSVTPAPGMAGGGLLGGRGSGTSDSNLAWVSRGEHIMPARAVAQPGVLALLEALRRSGGNLRGVLDGMGRFAAGGVVPRFAAGGLAGGMGHLGTVDLRTDHGSVTLMASGSAVDQLARLAVTKRMTSTGRKPGFIG